MHDWVTRNDHDLEVGDQADQVLQALIRYPRRVAGGRFTKYSRLVGTVEVRETLGLALGSLLFALLEVL